VPSSKLRSKIPRFQIHLSPLFANLIDTGANLGKTVFSAMNSERQKREEEIARILREPGLSGGTDLAFQQEIKKAADAIIEQETSRIQKTERAEGRKLTINTRTAGLALLIAGAAVSLFMPTVGAVLLLCAIAGILWATVMKPPKK
jgi:hypothetical protein